MRTFDMADFEITSVTNNLLTACTEYAVKQMEAMDTKAVGKIDYRYSIGVDEYSIVLFDHKENTEQDLILIGGEIKDIKWNHVGVMDTTNGQRLFICMLQVEYDWGDEVHYFIP